MTLIVGETSYITVAEADTIVQDEFMEDSAEFVYWEGLDDNSKSTLVRKSTSLLEKCLFRGLKVDPSQPLQYPRKIGSKLINCPYELKVAILEQGIRMNLERASSEAKLKELGVKSYSVDGSSITFSDNEIVKNSIGIYKDVYNNYIVNLTY